jgi:hypothetical protein
MSVVTPPTRRELVIVTLLLVFLLLVFRSNNQPFHPSQPSLVGSDNNISAKAPSRSHSGAPQTLKTVLSWGTSPVPQTKILAHVPGQSLLCVLKGLLTTLLWGFTGWSIFDKLYIFKGIVYIVTDEPSTVPNITDIYSKGLFIENGKEAIASRLPTDEDIKVISTKQAKQLFGTEALTMDGVTVRCISVSK